VYCSRFRSPNLLFPSFQDMVRGIQVVRVRDMGWSGRVYLLKVVY
jgi:hypothetical protein